MDKEYIEREALIRHLNDELEACGDACIDSQPIVYGTILGLKGAMSYANTLPAADVVEVRHGEWIESFSFDYWHYDCPFCDDGYAVKERDEAKPNYCQNCGAKMDGERKDERDGRRKVPDL